jgi:hypothetical protein
MTCSTTPSARDSCTTTKPGFAWAVASSAAVRKRGEGRTIRGWSGEEARERRRSGREVDGLGGRRTRMGDADEAREGKSELRPRGKRRVSSASAVSVS